MAYKTSALTKLVVNSLNFKSSLISQQNVFKYSRFLSSEVNKGSEGSTKDSASPQLLSKLFPQTAVPDQAEVKAEQEKQKREEEEEKKEQDKQWKRMKLGFYVFGISMGAMGCWTLYDMAQPERDSEGQIIEDEYSHLPTLEQYKSRILKNLNYYQKFVQEPSYEKLLPDPLKYPYIQPKYTLVLEMKDVLVHPDWTYQTGWRFKKRPGVDFFLEQLGRTFEIVVYTADHGMTVFPVLDALDPNGFIMYRLVRDATHFVDGHHIKSLDRLNRDLSKVIVIDWDANTTKFHPENSFNIPRWTGNDDDTTLFDLVAFLKTIVTADVDDVRDVMTYYKQFADPIEQFRENQRKLFEQIEEKNREEKQKAPSVVKKWTPSFLGHK
ncbi:hypothetical protein PVAND_002730 [Polypedilum vanderplanki]|uniref:Mitochondrial import inner membrane translocase subunit TIM50 n=1 Tax=Polypedilum vanderplanki TaxID=319348 RepID=A0A9J6BS16_POLVA|nr:hypothetical protein PVAND_002730 [Polypedilum vanderplanki]